jgi:hypothetical protein
LLHHFMVFMACTLEKTLGRAREAGVATRFRSLL